ncbi:MAG: hypothetical protein IM572_03135 [Chitinophagaceae bacterium]|jgi:hypothetical protein|nr:hypothetical protein [Microcystis sp. M065S1]MCA6491647.1 hypothetical protein [Chitinophagaceae bacterium]
MRIYEVTERTTAYNTGLAKVSDLCSADIFVVNHPPDGGLRINPPAGGW